LWFLKYINTDVHQLLWERKPNFDVEETGTDTKARKWLKHHTAPITPKGSASASLGIGLIDWARRASHVRAMQVKWLLQYLDASDSTILDCWFARTSLGRAAVLSTIPPKALYKRKKSSVDSLP
jgi:hypothetical protein